MFSRISLTDRPLAGLLVAALALAACGDTVDPADPEAAVVTYSFDISAARADVSPSSPIVAEIAQDPNLGRLTVKTDSVGQGLEAEYAFGSVAEFFTWRDAAAPLLGRVAALSPDTVAFSPRLAVRRPAHYRSVIGDLADGDSEATDINVTYRTSENEAGGAAGGGSGSDGVGDAGDIDAVTIICQPGLAGTIEECKASN